MVTSNSPQNKPQYLSDKNLKKIGLPIFVADVVCQLPPSDESGQTPTPRAIAAPSAPWFFTLSEIPLNFTHAPIH